MDFSLLPHQEETLTFIKENKRCLILSEMGTGKTLPILKLAYELSLKGEKSLFICPAFLTKNLESEARKFFPRLGTLIVDKNTSADSFRRGSKSVAIMSYERMKKCPEFFKEVSCVVFDEAHKIVNPKAGITQAAHYYTDKAPKLKYLVGMTGTPLMNKVPDLFSLLALINKDNFLDKYESYWKFCEHFTFKRIDRIAGRQVIKFEGLKNEKELKRELKKASMRHTLKDIGRLPVLKTREVDLACKVPAKKEKEFKDAWSNYSKYADLEDDLNPSYMTMKAFYANLKVKGTVEFSKNLIEEAPDDFVLILTDHVLAARNIAEALNAPCITGEMEATSRFEIAERFQSGGGGKYLVGTIKALGVGLTLTKANRLVFNDLAWNPATNNQAIGRILRLNQDKDCFVYQMNATEVDKNIMEKNMEKGGLIEILIDDTFNREEYEFVRYL